MHLDVGNLITCKVHWQEPLPQGCLFTRYGTQNSASGYISGSASGSNNGPGKLHCNISMNLETVSELKMKSSYLFNVIEHAHH